MTPRAFTPFFRCLERWLPAPVPPEGKVHPAPAPGNHAGEMWFLATATLLLTATAAIPGTAFLTSWWLRIPAIAGLLFLAPQIIMGFISIVSPWLSGPRLSREAAQDWSCLAAMTVYAAWRAMGAGWEAVICQAWLVFAVLNAVLALVPLDRGNGP